MKAAFLCEFATIRSALLQMAIIYLVIGVVVGIAMESSIAMVACISAMTPFLVVFTLSGYDEANGWQRFRACLPISRGAIVFGRYAIVLLSSVVMAAFAVVVALVLAQAAPYLPLADGAAESLAAQSDPLMLAASALAGTAIILLVTALILPFVLRFGMNKAMRIVPVVIVLLFVVAAPLAGDALAGVSGDSWMADLIAFVNDESNLPVIMAAVAGIALAAYAVSCAVAAHLYRGKEL